MGRHTWAARDTLLWSLAWLLACSLLCLAAPRAQAQVLRAPYLQRLTPTSVVVMWQTDLSVGVDSLVHYGTSVSTLSLSEIGTATDSPTDPGVRNHAVTIAGLTPRTTYYYDVGTTSGGLDAGGSAQHYFATPPVAGTIAPFDVWVVGDSGTDNAQQRAVRDAMTAVAGGAPELFLHVGDMAYNTGTQAQFTSRVFAPYADVMVHTPLFAAIGNHDASEGSSDSTTQSGPYFEAFTLPSAGQGGGVPSGTEAYYAFDYAHAHFIALDSDDSSISPGSPQLQWLAADLAAIPAAQQWIILWFHHPPYSKGSHDSDSASDSGGRMVKAREHVAPMLEAAGVDLVLSGHSHSYERSFLLAGAYGYGVSPAFATPSFATLLADGRVLEPGDGRSTGSGPYRKAAGRAPFGGTLYAVAGHGGNSLGGTIDHPAMRFSELRHGSLLLSIDETSLRLRNVRSDGVVSDDVWLHKPPRTCSGPSQCSDLRACTSDSCVAGKCLSTAVSCAAGQACNELAAGCACVPGGCADADVCTLDACHPVTGCTHTAIGCDDANACTTDSCSPASGCAHAAIGCDDANACTTDSCSPASGCAHGAISCDDDGNPCTDATCQPAIGCGQAFNSAGCDDGLPCTTGDLCANGTCSGVTADCSSSSDACHLGACDPATGTCVASARADGSPCPLGQCHAGSCVPPDADPLPVDSGAPAVDAGHVVDAAIAPAPDAAAIGMDASLPMADAATPHDAAIDAADGSTSGSAGHAATGKDASRPVRDAAPNVTDAGRDASTREHDAGADRPPRNTGCDCKLTSANPSHAPRANTRGAYLLLALLLAALARKRRSRAVRYPEL